MTKLTVEVIRSSGVVTINRNVMNKILIAALLLFVSAGLYIWLQGQHEAGSGDIPDREQSDSVSDDISDEKGRAFCRN